ncbi:trna-lysidine synthetase [Plasmopara halstedii]|uniref:tRNA(Ile)-lysidine synthetase n=1 Tax=Plasmopara halstedii TaxID=4781 RepID=A0A0N7L654_PLAHL|nr:trna-lysidine synthetase [Plasmopara halstedii]CEG43323.1 trna-lysidine synthetase [Plasmopara halstedii]|eukprot:XP_024579692.1 trna-lysidine synthetase [Plasmopara halstedii]
MNTKHEAHEVLRYWFGSDQAESYQTKWFPSDGSDKQKATDSEIKAQFRSLLGRAETGELESWRDTSPDTCVALILVLDQFSRHVYRDRSIATNREQLARNDIHALAIVEQNLLFKCWHKNLPVPHFVFALMPLRHSPTPERLHDVLASIEARNQLHEQHKDLLNKFRRTTTGRLQHLRGDFEIESTKVPDDDILERSYIETDESEMHKHRLYRIVDNYLTLMKASEYTHLAVSLSGGVDSMVVAYLMHKLKVKHGDFTIVAVHLDYGNRPESKAECDYVQRWCERFGMIFYKRRIDEVKRATTRRDDYERISRTIRYSTYAEVMKKYQIPGICFGHHRGDVQENVISNMMKGLSLFNLNGMHASSIVNGVQIWRPLLDVDKDVIFEYAHRYGVPYFKDTTPKWSTRGKLRNHLVPLLRDMYGDGFLNNLSALGAESTQCAEVVHQQVLSPIMNSVKQSQVAVWLDCGLLSDQPLFVCKEVFRQVCHSLMGNSMIREKPLLELIDKLNRMQNPLSRKIKHKNKEAELGSWVTLKKGNRSYLTKDKQLIIFRDQFFPQTRYIAHSFPIHVGKSYQFGPWKLQTQLLDGDHTTVQTLSKRDPWTIWDLVHANGISYVLLNAPQFVINCNSRPDMLRRIEKVITDNMPIVTSVGAFDVAIPAWVHVTLTYSQNALST